MHARATGDVLHFVLHFAYMFGFQKFQITTLWCLVVWSAQGLAYYRSTLECTQTAVLNLVADRPGVLNLVHTHITCTKFSRSKFMYCRMFVYLNLLRLAPIRYYLYYKSTYLKIQIKCKLQYTPVLCSEISSHIYTIILLTARTLP